MRFNIGPLARKSIPFLKSLGDLAVEAEQRGKAASEARAKATRSRAAVVEVMETLLEQQAQASKDNEEAILLEAEAAHAKANHCIFYQMSLASLDSNDDDDRVCVKAYDLKRDSDKLLRFTEMIEGWSFATVHVIDGKAHLVVRAEIGTAATGIPVLHLVVQAMGALEIVHAGGVRYLEFKGVRNKDDGKERFLIETKDPARLDGLFDMLVKWGAKEKSKAKSKSKGAENNDPNKA